MGRNAHQPGTQPVDGGGTQGLAVQRALEKQPQQHDERHRGRPDDDGLARNVQRPDGKAVVPERRVAETLCPKKQQAQTRHGKVHAHRHDQQRQRRGIGQRLVGHAVHQRTECGHQRHGQTRLNQQRKLLGCGPQREQRNGHGQRRCAQRSRQALQRRMMALEPGPAVHQRGHTGHDQQQPHGAGHLAGLQNGQGECAIGHKLPLGNEDHPGHGKHQHGGQPEQGVHGTIGDAVQHEDAGNRKVHGVWSRVKSSGRRPGGPPSSGQNNAYSTFQSPLTTFSITPVSLV